VIGGLLSVCFFLFYFIYARLVIDVISYDFLFVGQFYLTTVVDVNASAKQCVFIKALSRHP